MTATTAVPFGHAIALLLGVAMGAFAQVPNNRFETARSANSPAAAFAQTGTASAMAAQGSARITLLPVGDRASVVVELDEDVLRVSVSESSGTRSITVVIGPVKGTVASRLLQAAASSPLVSEIRVRGVNQGNQGTFVSLQIVGKSPLSGSVRQVVRRRVYIDLEPTPSASAMASGLATRDQARALAARQPAREPVAAPAAVVASVLPEPAESLPPPPPPLPEAGGVPPTLPGAAADIPASLPPRATPTPATDAPAETRGAATSVSRGLETSALHGTVTDQTGAVISGAEVTIENSVEQAWISQTDAQGRYVFERVFPGPYRLSVYATGFLEFTAPIELSADTTTRFNVGLQIGLSIALEVRETSGLATDPRKNGSAVILTGSRIEALPDNPRLFLNRLLLLAGSTGRGDVAVYVDGFREYQRLPPKETIEMIRINSNPFSAEFSQPSAKRIEITTRSGSDTFHGDAKLQVRSSRLDARNPLAESRPLGEYRNYNGYLQGPLRNERVGFLFYAGQWRQDDNALVHATVLDPTATVAQPFSATVSTPESVTSAMFKTDFTLHDQTINVSYALTDETHRNQGLDGGFDLLDRAYERSSREDVGRLWWSSVGRRSINDIRLEVTRGRAAASPRTTAPAILVFDAFNAGSNQNADFRATTTLLQASETFTRLAGTHAFKSGFLGETTDQTSVDRSGFGGTFMFGADVERDRFGAPVLDAQQQPISISPIEHYRRTVLGLPGYSPSQFAVTTGDPRVGVTQWNTSWFVLDDWSISNRVSLSYGVRQELQNNVKLRVDLAPRASLTWLVDDDGRNGVRLGGGLFYSRLEPGITLDVRKLDGVRRQQFIVQRPSFFPAVPSSFDAGALAGSTVYVKADDLRAPRSLITTVSYERQLPRGLSAIAEYLYSRGIDQLRLRAITYPAPGAPQSPVLQFESTGRSRQQELMLSLRGDLGSRLSLFGTYRLGRKDADTDGAYTIPADSSDLSSEYGASADDRRHQILASATWLAFGGLVVEPAVIVASGRPFNITTGLDNNGDTFFMDRPAFAVAGEAGSIATPFGVFNPNPRPGDRIIPRNFGREPWDASIELAVSKVLWKALTITADAQNLFNAIRLVRVNGVLTSPVFGMPNQALNGRRLELTIRYGF